MILSCLKVYFWPIFDLKMIKKRQLTLKKSIVHSMAEQNRNLKRRMMKSVFTHTSRFFSSANSEFNTMHDFSLVKDSSLNFKDISPNSLI